jgi:S-adenosylmethionine hydrolase
MSANPNPPAPIVTLTSDFGLRDAYVAAMKAAILRQTLGAVLIDVTHQVPAQDVVAGSFVLERAVDAFAPGTVHLAVVDPGVGGRRRILVVRIGGQYVVCPDNGLITWAWRRRGKGRAFELTWRPRSSSRTFHGRDIMAPAAGMLAAGRPVHEIAVPIHNPILLNIRPARSAARVGQIIYIDHFGNATTNIPREAVRAGATFEAGGRKLGPLQKTYGQVRRGEALALVGSAELIEIAVREKSAAQVLSLRVGDRVRILD